MTNRSRRTAADRTEARRRARLAAQGREEDLAGDEDEASSTDDDRDRAAGGSFLTRLFPPAPPLPGKGDPLAGFAYAGPLRSVVAGLYLLAQHPVPWLGMGALATIGRLGMGLSPALAIFASLISFGALIAAGWIGWPRPWLYGLMASIVATLLYAGIWGALVDGATHEYTFGQVFASAVIQETSGLQPLFGALAGWYGGYLRRRMAAVPRGDAAQRRRR
jgi:hypothetical protein